MNEPLGCLSEKVGLFRTKAGGKESHTTFEKINFNGKSSVVKCTCLYRTFLLKAYCHGELAYLIAK